MVFLFNIKRLCFRPFALHSVPWRKIIQIYWGNVFQLFEPLLDLKCWTKLDNIANDVTLWVSCSDNFVVNSYRITCLSYKTYFHSICVCIKYEYLNFDYEIMNFQFVVIVNFWVSAHFWNKRKRKPKMNFKNSEIKCNIDR